MFSMDLAEPTPVLVLKDIINVGLLNLSTNLLAIIPKTPWCQFCPLIIINLLSKV